MINSMVPVITRTAVATASTAASSSTTPPDWLVYDVPVIAAIAALAAAVFAIMSWSRMGRQISLANRQIDLANDQLRVAGDELAAVRDDFALSKKQFDMAQQQFVAATKAPDVIVSVFKSMEAPGFDMGSIVPSYREVTLQTKTWNRGSRISRNLEMFLYLTPGTRFLDNRTVRADDYTRIDGGNFIRYRINDPRRLHQGQAFDSIDKFAFNTEAGEISLFWRAWDDEYVYPSNAYGIVCVSFNLHL
jgi:hypothetical protein